MEANPNNSAAPDEGTRRSVAMPVLVVVVLIAAIGMYLALNRKPVAPDVTQSQSSAPALPQESGDELSAAVVREDRTTAKPRDPAFVIPSRPAVASTNAPTPALPAGSVYSQEVIARLTQLDPTQGRITPEQATGLKQNLKELVGQGSAAVPAIRQFLDRNQDFSYDDANGANQVGYPSLRAGLFDALKQIGGPEVTETFLGTLRSTADPAEIALLAKYLEQDAPGQFRQEAVQAARETLDQAAHGQVQVRDTAPLFQVLQSYGDGSVAADLDRTAPQWQYYSTMALASLPESQGVAALAQRVQDPARTGKSQNSFALQMLAQMAYQSPDAAAVLLEQARQNQIPDRAWTKVVEGLAGDQYQIGKPPSDSGGPPQAGLKTYHIESGNQNFYSLPFNMYGTPEQAAQRRAVVDQLLAATQNPAAIQALQNARAVLSAPTP